MAYEIDTERVFSPFSGYGYASNYQGAPASQSYVADDAYQPASNHLPVMRIPPGYKLVPIGSTSGSDSANRNKKLMIIAGVVIIAGIVIYMMMKNRKRRAASSGSTPSQAIKKLPTARLARNLYERLARNGSATESTMAELEVLSREGK